MHLVEQDAKPQEKCIPSLFVKRKGYDPCPHCGKRKARRASQCVECKRKDGRSPVDNTTYIIDGVECRRIPLTQGQHALVWSRDYDDLMQWTWFAVWNRCTKSFYAARSSKTESGKSRMIQMHRSLLGLQYGDSTKGDHKESGTTLDNRRCNLRPADGFQNAANSRRSKISKSGFRGVSPNRLGTGWRAECGGEYFGTRSTPEDAYALYCEAALRKYGEFAKLT